MSDHPRSYVFYRRCPLPTIVACLWVSKYHEQQAIASTILFATEITRNKAADILRRARKDGVRISRNIVR